MSVERVVLRRLAPSGDVVANHEHELLVSWVGPLNPRGAAVADRDVRPGPYLACPPAGEWEPYPVTVTSSVLVTGRASGRPTWSVRLREGATP